MAVAAVTHRKLKMLVKIMDGLFIGDKDADAAAMDRRVTHILRRARGRITAAFDLQFASLLSKVIASRHAPSPPAPSPQRGSL